MKRRWCGLALVLLSLSVSFAHAQGGSIVRRLAESIVETVTKKGGKEAAEELACIGGEKTVKEAVEKAVREGGGELAEKLERYSAEYGIAFLRAARRSPKTFIEAFEKLPQGIRDAAIQAVRREPELMAELVEQVGADALEVAAKHPGVGGQIVKDLGPEGAVIAKNLTTDCAVQLRKISGKIAKLPGSERSEILELVKRTPEKVLDLLEKHPNVLKTGATTGAALTAFLASKDRLFGGYKVTVSPDGSIVRDYEPGLLERILTIPLETFHAPLALLIGLLGLAIAVWAAIKLWAAYRISKFKVDATAVKYAEEKEKQKPQE